jgi:lysozyme family protein
VNFDQAFDRLFGNEGGYVDNPADPGGETNYGISKRSYPDVDIKNLTRDGAKAIYLRDFWTPLQADHLDDALMFQVFDFAVNSGIQTAIRYLQRAIGVADDGHFGKLSQSALGTMTTAQAIIRFVAMRLDFWTSLSTWAEFGRGWARRARDDLRYAAQDT